MRIKRWEVVMTPLRGLGRRSVGRDVTGPAFFSKGRAEIEASKLDHEMNRRSYTDSKVMFEFRTCRVGEHAPTSV